MVINEFHQTIRAPAPGDAKQCFGLSTAFALISLVTVGMIGLLLLYIVHPGVFEGTPDSGSITTASLNFSNAPGDRFLAY